MVVFLTEIMPIDVLTSGFSLAYSLATAVFGGFTPAICTYLIHRTGNRAVPGLWLPPAAACGLLPALLATPQHQQAKARHEDSLLLRPSRAGQSAGVPPPVTSTS